MGLFTKVGRKVKWETIGHGARRVRTGVIVAVVPAKKNPADYIPDQYAKGALRMAKEKRHPVESYLVWSEETEKLYWPDPVKL